MSVETSDATMAFIEKGDGKPIMFVHGWPTNANIWKYQTDALADEFHVLAVDLPGFGDTAPYGEASMKAFAAEVKKFIEARQLPPVFLAGWSMGAGVVMSYNQHFGSDGISGFGIVDDCPKLFPGDAWEADRDTTFSRDAVARWRQTWQTGDRESVIRELTTIEFKHPERFHSEIEWAIEESLKSDPEFAMAALLEVMELDFREGLKRIDVPCLLLYGRYSKMTTPANCAFMNETIPGSKLVMFEESAHNPMIEEWEKFNAEVREFVRNL